jgi:hypothetical protein
MLSTVKFAKFAPAVHLVFGQVTWEINARLLENF